MREKEGHAWGQKPGNHQPDKAAVRVRYTHGKKGKKPPDKM